MWRASSAVGPALPRSRTPRTYDHCNSSSRVRLCHGQHGLLVSRNRAEEGLFSVAMATDAPQLPPTSPDRDAMWRGILLGTDHRYRRSRLWLKHVPGAPRCQFCAAPFSGLFAPWMRAIGRGSWHRNPRYCHRCFSVLEASNGGAEIECSLLFADVRGSTTLAEGMPATQFRGLLDRFYATATEILVARDGIIDKFVGDEVVAIFIPALTNEAHPSRAFTAARQLLAATGHLDSSGPWLPIGVGIATGVAFVGSVGSGAHLEFTAIGDVVNTAARLASAAVRGEILLTVNAAERAGIPSDNAERRTLELKGKAQRVEVVAVSTAVRGAKPAARG
jgi:adenylate cyclase